MIDESEAFWKFVSSNAHADPAMLRLRHAGRQHEFDVARAIDQIECRQKTSGKLSRFLENPRFLFPDTLAAEQASHQDVAQYHASLIAPGETVLDMTAGLGIDAMTMAENGARVTAIDIDPCKAEHLRHNSEVMGLHLNVECSDSVRWLEENPERHFDTIFIDPARRDNKGGRTYAFADCQPDLTVNLPLILSRCKRLIVKASPMLDITQAFRELPQSRHVVAVSVRGECKELAFICSDDETTTREAVMIDAQGKREKFAVGDASDTGDDRGDVAMVPKDADFNGKWLYEPDAAVMKLACWRELGKRFPGICKLDRDTHLFVSEVLYTDFPGRILKITAVPKGAELKGVKANVAVRNYPLSAEQLKKKIKAASGSDTLFVYGVRAGGRPMLFLAEKIL